MNIYKIFVIITLSIYLYLKWIFKCWNDGIIYFGLFTYKVPNIFLKMSLLTLTFVNIVVFLIIAFSIHSYKTTNIKKPPNGNRGEIGLRGEKGINGICGSSCGNNLCYKKIMRIIVEAYNSWREIKGIEKISKFQEINNLFIKSKIKQICSSKKYKKLLQKDGVEKVDKFFHNLWKKWILIILKYEKGMEFLDSEHLTDVDFDLMISNEDKKYASFDNLKSPGTPSRGEESPFDELKKYDVWYWGGSSLLKPKIINKCDLNDKKENPVLPSPILKMLESNNYKKNLWNNQNTRQRGYYRGYLGYNKVPYKHCLKRKRRWPWERKRCVKSETRYNYIPKCDRYLRYEARDLGTKKVSFYRSNNYVDNNEQVKYKDFRPLGDVVVNGLPKDHFKRASDTCLPKNPKDNYSCQRNIKNMDDPAVKTVLVSGDTKPPIDYKRMYGSRREVGSYKKSYGVSFWRPIPPDGYRCLGDVIQPGYHNQKPSTDLIRCVPKKCTRRVNNSNKFWDTESKDFERCKSVYPCDCNMEKVGPGASEDTDHLTQYGQVNMYKSTDSYNLFRTRDPNYQDDNGKFYEIIPKGQTGDSGQKSCLDEPTPDELISENVDNENDSKPKNFKEWIVPKKDDPKYSILNIYK